jgi:hypothetical protein
MDSKIRFNGGTISLREVGSMYDSKTGKERKWDKALKITSEGQTVTVGQDFLVKLSALIENPDFSMWSKDLMP